MIQLFSRHFIVVNRQGRQTTFSFDDLRQDLFACFRTCGVREVWPAENIALIVEEHLERQRSEATIPVSEDQVDALVSSILFATGYGEVAAEYHKSRQLGPAAAVTGLAAWDDRRIQEQLAKAFPLSGEEIRSLAGEVGNALTRLAFGKVSDEMIRQLGAHLMQARTTVAGQASAPAGPVWLFPPEHWPPLVPNTMAAFLSTGIVSVLPVSRLLPRARARLDLSRLAASMGAAPLTELGFLPQLRHACNELPGLLRLVRGEIVRIAEHAGRAPTHLIVQGLDQVLRHYLVPLNRRASEALVNDIGDVLQRDVSERVDFELIVTVR